MQGIISVFNPASAAPFCHSNGWGDCSLPPRNQDCSIYLAILLLYIYMVSHSEMFAVNEFSRITRKKINYFWENFKISCAVWLFFFFFLLRLCVWGSLKYWVNGNWRSCSFSFISFTVDLPLTIDHNLLNNEKCKVLVSSSEIILTY